MESLEIAFPGYLTHLIAQMNVLLRNRLLVTRFALCLYVLVTSHAGVGAQSLTARQIIDRIKAKVGVPWTEPTVDTVKAGDPDTPVKGIAVTMMATLDVLQRAAASGHNLVITHEPTFYDHLDPTEGLVRENDPVTAAKLEFVKDNGLVVWRFHDYSHRKRPDLIQTGVLRALGWSAFQDKDAPWLIKMPATTLSALAADIRKKLGPHAMRVVGDASLKVTTVALIPGAAGFQMHRKALQREDVEVLVIGEAREWETVEYVDDAVAAGQEKGLILIGHIPSEQPGMEDATKWIKTFVTEVPVAFVPAKDPFWPAK
jgi:putative NIF3 family GTP cyclohydrolase 1 type 2